MDLDLSAVDQLLVEEAVSHKQALVSFALTPPFERPLRECRHQGEPYDLDDFSQMVAAVETLLFTHRYDDGSSVLDRYLDRHRKLDEQARELIASWNDSVEGVFEVAAQKGDWLLLMNLFDEMPYTALASAGAESLPHVSVGSFLVTRVLPVEEVWLLSGHQVLFAPKDRAAIAELVAERSMQQPELVLRNPAKRRTAEQTARAMNQSFLDCFGTNLPVVRGDEVTKTSQRFYEFHTRRVSTDEDAVQRAPERGRHRRLRRAV